MRSAAGDGRQPSAADGRPQPGLAAFGAFLAAAAIIAAAAAASLWWPHGFLSTMWLPKEAVYRRLLPVRTAVGAGFALLALVLAGTTVGWTRRRRWAWHLSLGILLANLAGDLASALLTRGWADLAGAGVEALMVLWLLTPRRSAAFAVPPHGRR